VYNNDTATLLNLTIYNNAANTNGSGVHHSTSAVSTSVKNTIVAGNTGSPNCSPGITSSGNNLWDNDASCVPTAGGDIIGAIPGSDFDIALVNNGGPTLTHALVGGSQAIDAGNNAGCPAVDQRGNARPQGPTCDIGAYEFP